MDVPKVEDVPRVVNHLNASLLLLTQPFRPPINDCGSTSVPDTQVARDIFAPDTPSISANTIEELPGNSSRGLGIGIQMRAHH